MSPTPEILEAASRTSEIARPQPRGRRVLIIEDHVDTAEGLGAILELDHHTVELAHCGPTGLATARAFRPDVVLCDIGLPGMDGYAVARAFRADEALRPIFLVALSGYTNPTELARAAAAGFDKYLGKPPSLPKLADLLSRVRRLGE